MERVLEMWDHAYLAYRGSRVTGEQLPSGGYVIQSVLTPKWSVGASQQCYYAVSGQTGIIACSGSNDAFDWVSNFMGVKREWPELGRGTAATFHAGTLGMFRDSIKPWLDTLKLTPRLILVGHSAGGMAAQAIALHLTYARGRSGLELFVFGAPFIGNDVAARLMADTRIPAQRVTMEGDSVATITMPYMISGYAPWGVPSASATPRSIVIFGDDASSRIGYRFETPSYALPTPTSFALHLAYGLTLRNIVSAAKAQSCTYSALSYHADKAAQCVGSKLCVRSGLLTNTATPVPCGTAGYCNQSNNCYYK